MLYRMLTPDFKFEDGRGALIQLVHEGYEQINVLYSNNGVERGKHYHKTSREAFYVVSGNVSVELSKDGLHEKLTFVRGDFFEIQPFVVHSMYFNEDCTLIAMYDKCVEMENGEKDIYPVS